MKSVGGKTFCFVFLWVLFVTAGLFICPKTVLASGSVVINEIMFNPEGTDGILEWVELYNNSDSEINLENWEVDPDSGSYFNLKGKTIKSGKFLVVTGLSGMRNSYGQVSLYNSTTHNESTMIDYVQYGKWDIGTTENKIRDRAINKLIWTENDFAPISSEGKSMELKIDGKDNNSSDDWQESYVTSGTPGEKNSEKPKPKEYSNRIRLNEILPNPSGDESKDEYIEFYNSSNEDIDLENWELKDAGTGKYIFPKGTEIKKENYLAIYRKDFEFAINNSDETISLLNPDDTLISSIFLGSKSFDSDISYNFDGVGWKRSSQLTPGKENEFDETPDISIKKDDKIYKNIYASFEVKTGDENQKVTWDFGDGGSKSYLQKTRHKYLKTGTYQVSLKIEGKSDDFEENFEVEVNKFKESKLKIVKVKANPKGKDAKSESITIQNNSKKKINLKNWSIATGWENLYNHPISKKLIIKPGESKEITKKYSAFTLNNKQTKIELRRPDGSVESKIKYSKKEGVEDDEVYEKTDNGWAWNTSTNTDEERINANQTQDSVENNVGSEEKSLVNESLATESISKVMLEENTDNNQNNQVENNSEVQIDEPIENSSQEEILGVEMVKENMPDNNNNKTGFFQSILLSANQTINNFINFFF